MPEKEEMKSKTLDQKIRRLEAVIEYDYSNKLHRMIGVDRWMEYRLKVPEHIPEDQISRYIIKQIKKDERFTLTEKVWNWLDSPIFK